MYTLLRTTPPRVLVTTQAPAIAGALVLAELFYKFHSFTLELLAFLATWFVLDALISGLVNRRPAERMANEG